MTVTNANVICRLRALVSRTSLGNCAQPEEEIWFPVAPSVTQLPPVPAEVVNENPRPANSAELPEDFDIDNPDLCSLFTSILSESNDPVYETELETTSLVLPYNEIVINIAFLRTYFDLYRFNYSLKPRLSDISLIAKAQSTSVRLYKFKAQQGSFGLTGVDAKIFPERYIVSQAGAFTSQVTDAAITPIRIFCDSGPFVTSFSEASVKVPGTFSYAWSSTSYTSLGAASPIAIAYRRIIHQSIYPASLLLENGARAGAEFYNLRWYVSSAINESRSILGMNIRLFHSSATVATSTLSPISGETKTTVYSDGPTVPFLQAETVGVLQVDFLEPFVWNGVDSIVIENCTSQNEGGYADQGAMRRQVSSTTVRRYAWTDASGNSCDTTPNLTATYQIAVEMDFN